MSRRRSTLVALVLALGLIAAACGGGDDGNGDNAGSGDDGAKEAQKVGLVYDTTGRGDQSFNDAAARGLDKAKAEFGLTTKELTPSGGGENRGELLTLLSEEGYPLIFAVGFAFGDSLQPVAKANPDTRYAIIDGFIDEPNVASLGFAENEGSYLVGAAAALKSKSAKIGFIGGVEVDLIKKFEAGFVAGAKQVKPNIQVDVKYITPAGDFSGFNDPAKAKVIATGMYTGGADVIFHAAGGSGAGLFDAAVAAGDGKWAIGVDSDQYLTASDAQKPHILTSMLKRVDVAVYETTKAFVNDNFKGGATTFDLKVDGVGYSTSGGFVDDIKAQLEDLKKKIIDGTIKVPTKP